MDGCEIRQVPPFKSCLQSTETSTHQSIRDMYVGQVSIFFMSIYVREKILVFVVSWFLLRKQHSTLLGFNAINFCQHIIAEF